MFDASTIVAVAVGALLAGFTTGFAGFGTGLVASGLWFHVLPAEWVPPLVALASVAAQLVGVITVRRAFDWRRLRPYLVGGMFGVPLGVTTLSLASPDVLRASMGIFLVAYGLYQLNRVGAKIKLSHRSWRVDGVVGAGGGFLGGFAGLSGPLPLMWLQLQGGSADGQRAVYQPFNLAVLTMASVGMLYSGQVNPPVVFLALLCLPVTLVGAAIGSRVYRLVTENAFHRFVLTLLLVSGAILVVQAWTE